MTGRSSDARLDRSTKSCRCKNYCPASLLGKPGSWAWELGLGAGPWPGQRLPIGWVARFARLARVPHPNLAPILARLPCSTHACWGGERDFTRTGLPAQSATIEPPGTVAPTAKLLNREVPYLQNRARLYRRRGFNYQVITLYLTLRRGVIT